MKYGILALALTACIVKQFSTGPRLTGTCEGACDHYVECKPGHPSEAMTRCQTECPQVFSDEDSLRGFESLSCKDTLEYVDGNSPRAAQNKH
ncbi:MAG: hypothetical protein ABI678_02000 [Kofleriaceae bacterium]